MSNYCLVVAVSNPASVDPLVRMGSALARANNGSLIVTSVTEVPPQIPVTADVKFASQQEAIIERALSVAGSVGVPAEGESAPESRAGPIDRLSLLGRTVPERLTKRAPCDVYVEQIGPGPAVPGDSVLVSVAEGAHAEAVLEVVSDIGTAYDMQVHLVTVVSPGADVHPVEQREQRLRTYLNSEIKCAGEVTVLPGESVVDTLVELTGEHDVTVLGPRRIRLPRNS